MEGALRSLIFLSVTIAAICFTFSSCGSSGGGGDPGSGTSNKGDSSKLSSAFATNCASCHGSTGGGGAERSIQGYSGQFSSFLSTVRSGRGRMPTISASVYSDSDATADYNYLKSL